MCNAILTFEDLDTGEIITLGDGELTIRENTITFTTEQLTDNRHCNVSVNAFNVAGSFTSYTTLSKDRHTVSYVGEPIHVNLWNSP